MRSHSRAASPNRVSFISLAENINSKYPEPRRQYNRSIGPLNRSVLSEKVPITFNPKGIVVHTIPSATLVNEEKVSLYSEIERLTMVNYELKRQNEVLSAEIDDTRYLLARVPEMEAVIHALQEEVAAKAESLHQNLRDQDVLKYDNINLSKLEPAYNQLLDHNRALLEEVDALDVRLKDLLKERDILEAKSESLRVMELRLEDLTRNYQRLSDNFADKEHELSDCKDQIMSLTSKINILMIDNQQLQSYSVEKDRERDMLYTRMQDQENSHLKTITSLKAQIESEHRINLDYEINKLTGEFNSKITEKDAELVHLRRINENLENQIVLLATEAKHLQEGNINKSGDIDTLNLRIINLEHEIDQLKKDLNIQNNLRAELLNKRTEQDNIILQLRRELTDLSKLEILIKERDNEIEKLKAQAINNERVWELRLRATAENEARDASNKFSLEKSMLEREVTVSKEQIVGLESRVSLLSNEISLLNEHLNKRITEVNELRNRISNQEVNSKLSLDESRIKLEINKKQSLDAQRQEIEQVHQDRYDEIRRLNEGLEQKIMLLIDKNNELSLALEDRNKDAEEYVTKIRVMESLHKQQLEEAEKRTSFGEKMTADRQLSTISLKHTEEKATLDSKILYLTSDLERLRGQNQIQEKELEMLRQQVVNKEAEINQERRRYNELEAQRARDINEVRDQLEIYKRSNVDVTTSQIRFEAEKSSLSSQLTQYKEQAGETEKRLVFLTGENEKMRTLYNEKANELETLRYKYMDLEQASSNEKGAIEAENEHLKKINMDIRETTLRSSSEKSQLESQIKQLKIINENGKLELEKFFEIMNKRKKEHDFYIQQNEDLRSEVDKLTKQLRDNDNTIPLSKSDGQSSRLAEVERDRDFYKAQNERLNVQLLRANTSLQERSKDFEFSQKKYGDSVPIVSSQLDKDIASKLAATSALLSTINITPGTKDYQFKSNVPL